MTLNLGGHELRYTFDVTFFTFIGEDFNYFSYFAVDKGLNAICGSQGMTVDIRIPVSDKI